MRAGLFRVAAILWTPITADWEPWLRERFTATVGAAAYQALLNLCPELDGDGLVVDLYAGPREPDDELFGQPSTEVLGLASWPPAAMGTSKRPCANMQRILGATLGL